MAPATDLPFRAFEGVPVWLVPPQDSTDAHVVQGVRETAKGPLVALDGVNDLSAAEPLAGATMLVRVEDLPDDWADLEELESLIGLKVVDATHGDIGTIQEIIMTGANDVWVVQGRLGEVLLPVIDDVVRSVDLDEGVAQVALLPGLLEEPER